MQEFPWGHERRFNAYAQYFKRTFGARVQKVSIDAGFTCPNRDGTVAFGGCTFCDNEAFNPAYCDPNKSITEQIEIGIRFHKHRYQRASQYLAYFQAFTNTHAPLTELRKIFDDALSVEGVVGLVIGTRPDCLDSEKLEYFAELSETHYLILEIGIESCYNETLKRINRGHDFQEAVGTISKAAEYGIKTGTHMIFGLPGETEQMMLDQAATLSALPLNNIKFHQLQLIAGTAMVKDYEKNPDDFLVWKLSDYLDFVIRFIERLNPNFVIERFFAEAPPEKNVSPIQWDYRNDQMLNLLERELGQRETWQGRLFATPAKLS